MNNKTIGAHEFTHSLNKTLEQPNNIHKHTHDQTKF